MLLSLSLFLAIGFAGTTKYELDTLRDDIIHVCMKLGGGNSANLKHCRRPADGFPSPHVNIDCWKSGWSGRGKLRCKYAAEIYGFANKDNAGFEEACPGCLSSTGRRRMETDDDDVFADDAGKETTEESQWEDKRHPVTFNLENIEDETEVLSLGNVSACLLQGFEYYKPESKDVRSKCVLSRDSDGIWELAYASAKCNVICFPHRSSRYF